VAVFQDLSSGGKPTNQSNLGRRDTYILIAVFVSSTLIMKVTAPFLLLFLATSLAGAASSSDNDNNEHSVLTGSRHHPTHLRTSKDFQPSTCNDIKNEKQCFATKDESTDKSCVWCDCQAVPPVCVTVRFVQFVDDVDNDEVMNVRCFLP
jgi:hypothetical protein